MDQNEKYQYNFQYSLANYNPLYSEDPSTDEDFSSQDQQTILRRSNEIIDFKCFLSKETEQIIKTLFTHFIQLYGRIAVRLFRICNYIYQNMDLSSSSFIKNFQETLELERQKMIENLSELSKIFHDEKQKYLKLISLCISGSIFKILTLQKQIQEIQFETVFHTVYWQITGTHSTSQMLKKLLGETFNGVNFHNYLINEESPIRYTTQSVTQSFVKNSASFQKNTFTNSNYVLNHSVKDIKLKKVEEGTVSNGDIAFSKMIKRKEKMNKENSVSYLNQYPCNQIKNKNSMKKQKQNQRQAPSQLNQEQSAKSNHKVFNFKKDRNVFFQNFSKTQSNKKAINDFGSSNKKPTFASYLQQKKLQF